MIGIQKGKNKLALLPACCLVKTSSIDHADWNYRGVLGHIQQIRFNLIRKLLSGERFPRLLELGFGSGIFMPELAKYCDHLLGADIHPKCCEVSRNLKGFCVNARLIRASALQLPFASLSIDCIVAVSALEFIQDIERACNEIRRVLRPGGTMILVTPGHSKILDFGLHLMTGESATNDFENRRQRVIPTLLRNFYPESHLVFPALASRILPVYQAFRLIKKTSHLPVYPSQRGSAENSESPQNMGTKVNVA